MTEQTTQTNQEPAAAGTDQQLGEGGKRALEAERAARRDSETARKAAEDRAGKIAGRLLAAEVRAAAAGKLADPADAARMLDLTQFELGDDGYDSAAISAAVDGLVKAKPYLGARATGFQGSGDGGARTGAASFSRESLKGMSPQEIDKARREGKLDHLLKR